MKRSAIYILLVIFGFLYIYNPLISLMPVQPLYFIYGVSLAVIFIDIKKYCSILSKKFVFTLVCIVIALFAYSLIHLLPGGQSHTLTFTKTSIKIGLDVLLVAPAFYLILDRFRMDANDLIRVLIYIGVIQSFFSVIIYLNEDIRNYIMFSFLDLGDHKILQDYFFNLRGYGIATTYLYAFPIYQALCIILLFYIKDSINKRMYYAALILLTFSIIVNARIGLVVFPIIFIVYLTLNYKDKLFLLKLSAISILIVFTISIYYQPIRNYLVQDNETMSWVVTGLELSLGISNLNKASTVEVLVEQHLHFPSEVNTLMFGSGDNIFSNPYSKFKASDIGYVRNIYYGGITILALLFIFYLKLLKPLYSKYDKSKIFLYVSCLLLFIICHLKGDIFDSNDFTRGIALLSIFIYNYKNTRYSSSNLYL